MITEADRQECERMVLETEDARTDMRLFLAERVCPICAPGRFGDDAQAHPLPYFCRAHEGRRLGWSLEQLRATGVRSRGGDGTQSKAA